MKSATLLPRQDSSAPSYFNPRTREVCDAAVDLIRHNAVFISIHAPVKGATGPFQCDFKRRLLISIHAPVKGATLGAPRLYRRHGISIHAPVKGATRQFRIIFIQRFRHFNPRTREGCDMISAAPEVAKVNISIHAPVKGATIRCRGRGPRQNYFNPRTREGCDVDILAPLAWYSAIPIHAPVKGATCTSLWRHRPDLISIHAPVKGATTLCFLSSNFP